MRIDQPDTPPFIGSILRWWGLWPAARVLLVSSYLIGGVMKLLNFDAAVLEQERFGLHPGWLWAVLAIVVELGGSALVILGRAIWLGAGALGCLTFIAMLVANDFWNLEDQARFTALNSFFEHFGLIAGLVLVTLLPEVSRSPAQG